MSHWSEPCVSLHERWRGPSALGGGVVELSSCEGWRLGTGTRSPSALSVNGTQDQLCFLCLLTSSPVIKTPPGGIVLTIWAVMYGTKESGGLVSGSALWGFLSVWREGRLDPACFAFDDRLRLLSRSIISWL